MTISNDEAKAQLRAETERLHDHYLVLLALRDAAKFNSEAWQRLDFEQKKAFREWLFAQDRLTMRSAPESYDSNQRMS